MKIKSDLPKGYDEKYPLDIKEQTIIIELSIINYYLLEQIRMPMVVEMTGGDELVACFQRCVGACVLTLLKAGLLTDEFCAKNKDILDEETGIRNNIVMNTMEISDLSYDLHYLFCRYMVVLGHEERLIPEQDALYGDQRFFKPKCT